MLKRLIKFLLVATLLAYSSAQGDSSLLTSVTNNPSDTLYRLITPSSTSIITFQPSLFIGVELMPNGTVNSISGITLFNKNGTALGVTQQGLVVELKMSNGWQVTRTTNIILSSEAITRITMSGKYYPVAGLKIGSGWSNASNTTVYIVFDDNITEYLSVKGSHTQ